MSEKGGGDEDTEFALEIPEDMDASIEGDKLVIAGEEYPLANIKAKLEERAKENAHATVVMSSGGTTLGAVALGPPGALAGAVIGGSIGYLIDEGYISWGDREEVEEVEMEEVVDEMDPVSEESTEVVEDPGLPEIFHEYEDRWYRPDSDIYVLTIRTPDGGRAYFETIGGAEERLRKEYIE